MTQPRNLPHPLILFWLTAVNAASLLVGLVLVFGQATPPMVFYRDELAQTFWNEAALPETAQAYYAWTMALIGAATVGWAITNLFIVRNAYAEGAGWATHALVWSTLAWASLEIFVSLKASANVEVAFVLAVAVSILAPLVRAAVIAEMARRK